MKRIRLTEAQFDDLSKKEAIEVQDDARQAINKMRSDTSDMKQGELQQMAHNFIDKAFKLGQKYADMELDIEGRAMILKKLHQLNKKIDSVN